METVFCYTEKTAFFSSDERRWINRIHALKEKFPDQVTIICEPDDNGGCIYASLPHTALHVNISPPRTLSDEQRAAAIQRLNGYRRVKPDDLSAVVPGDTPDMQELLDWVERLDEFESQGDGIMPEEETGGSE